MAFRFRYYDILESFKSELMSAALNIKAIMHNGKILVSVEGTKVSVVLTGEEFRQANNKHFAGT